MNPPSQLRIRAIAASMLLFLSVESAKIELVQAQPISACSAILEAEDPDTEIGIYDGAGTKFYLRYYGRPGDRVSIVQGDREGLAIAEDQYGREWVKIELESPVRGWVRRDYLSEFECYSGGNGS